MTNVEKRLLYRDISLITNGRILARNPTNVTNVCKSFSASGSLLRHKMTHSNEKRYKCDECGNSFTQRSSLHRHKLMHSGEKPFQCDDCGKSFLDRSKLKRHGRVHAKEAARRDADDMAAGKWFLGMAIDTMSNILFMMK